MVTPRKSVNLAIFSSPVVTGTQTNENDVHGVKSPILRSSIKKRGIRPLGDKSVNIIEPTLPVEEKAVEGKGGFQKPEHLTKIQNTSDEEREERNTHIEDKDEKKCPTPVPVGDNEVLKWLIKKLKVQNNELKEEVSYLEDSISKVRAEKEKADSSLQATMTLVEEVTLLSQDKDGEIESLRTICFSAEKATRDMKLAYDEQIQSLKAELKSKETKISELEVLVENMSQKLISTEEFAMDALSDQLRLQHHLELAQFVKDKAINQSAYSLQRLENELNKEKEEKMSLMSNNANIISQMKEANNQSILELKEQHGKHELNLNLMHKSEIQSMQQLIHDKDQKVSELEITLKDINGQLGRTLSRLQEQGQVQDSRIQTLESNCHALRQQLDIKACEMKKMNGSFFNLSVEKKNLEFKTERLQAHIAHLERINREYHELIGRYKFKEVKLELTSRVVKVQPPSISEEMYSKSKFTSLKDCGDGMSSTGHTDMEEQEFENTEIPISVGRNATRNKVSIINFKNLNTTKPVVYSAVIGKVKSGRKLPEKFSFLLAVVFFILSLGLLVNRVSYEHNSSAFMNQENGKDTDVEDVLFTCETTYPPKSIVPSKLEMLSSPLVPVQRRKTSLVLKHGIQHVSRKVLELHSKKIMQLKLLSSKLVNKCKQVWRRLRGLKEVI